MKGVAGSSGGRDKRISELKSMSGTDFAVATAADLLLLRKEERAKAIKTLQAIDDAVSKEAEAAR